MESLFTLRYGWIQVAYHPCEVAHEVWTLLARQGYRVAFQRCGQECAAPENPVTPTAVLATPDGKRENFRGR